MKFGRFGILALLFVPGLWAQSIAGLWDATLIQGGTQIPFKVGFSGSGSNVKGWFFNGEEKESSNGGTLIDNSLI